MSDSSFFIVFPRSDTTRLAVIELFPSNMYELSDYSVASRKEFDNALDAHQYAVELAKKHNLTYVADSDVIGQEALYLD